MYCLKEVKTNFRNNVQFLSGLWSEAEGVCRAQHTPQVILMYFGNRFTSLLLSVNTCVISHH